MIGVQNVHTERQVSCCTKDCTQRADQSPGRMSLVTVRLENRVYLTNRHNLTEHGHYVLLTLEVSGDNRHLARLSLWLEQQFVDFNIKTELVILYVSKHLIGFI